MIARYIAAFAVLASIVANAHAQDGTSRSIKVTGAWSRVAPPNAPVLGGYLSITNGGNEPDELVKVTSPISDDVQIHTSSIEDGMAKMRRVTEGVEVPAGATVTFEPGGLHLMLLRPKARPAEGETLRVTLTFRNAGEVEADLAVSRSLPEDTSPHQEHAQ